MWIDLVDLDEAIEDVGLGCWGRSPVLGTDICWALMKLLILFY